MIQNANGYEAYSRLYIKKVYALPIGVHGNPLCMALSFTIEYNKYSYVLVCL